jgi:NAD(P)-dependent dehydrogenase (short-subunit alcohol dehydrogenase family)
LPRPACLVTGSSSGIGAAVVRHFAAQGWDVVVNYNSGRERAEAIATQIRQDHGVDVFVIGADLSQRDEPFRLVDAAVAHFGRLDVAISNSGVTNYIRGDDGELIRHRFHETPPDHLDREMARVLDLNLMGAYRFGQRALKHMIDAANADAAAGAAPDHRSLLFITSISDVAPETTRIPYGVSKAGLNHAVIGAALEGGRHNITVNALRPGVVDTPLTARPSGLTDEVTGREYTVADTYALMAEGGSQALPRIGDPEDIAVAAWAFTHIPYMTGQFVAVDGGFTLAGGFPNRELFLQEGIRKRRDRG